ncbi:hypothetical protein [Pedobacter frigoris]|uniref:DUF4468 domain-containing protein n=1 Tax=Pedobacter frigoris TaxID=2571272 RepID=A0A4U1CNF6_9SPHI|nr:hypothetical protein [Pedobacter frigoris]TKC06944.1 hypothetical protein FA047_06645 [Pedobacter frigoris]
MKNLLPILFLFCVITSKAQVVPNQAIVAIKNEMIDAKRGFAKTLIDTILVRNNFTLEPVKVFYSSDEIILSTTSTKSSRREISSGSRLRWYCFTNLQEMVGMTFDINEKPSAKTIQPYQFNQETPKKGHTFINEPFLTKDLSLTDYVKEKDTVINGQKCIMIKRTKVIQNVYKGIKMEKIVQFRLAINPKLTSYAFPFVSEKITQHFGGGAIVYIDGITDSGVRGTIRYSYSEFSPADTKLFNHYQQLYESNITLLDKFKKKQ